MWEIEKCNKQDEHYPENLKLCKDAPDTLYYVGDISVCSKNVIAVVGKREPSIRNLVFARQIAKVLTREGYTILNGLAFGTDSYVVEGALEEKGKIIAVMPGGLDEIYPQANTELARRILENGGCLISGFPEGLRPQKETFAKRDQMQVMISGKVIIVDANKDGGAMQMAEFAIKHAKPLGCFLDEKGIPSDGNSILIKSRKVAPLGNTEEILQFVKQS